MEISPEYSLERVMLKLKLQCFVNLMQRTDSFGKAMIFLKNWRWEEKVMTKEEIVGWHHCLHGHEFEYSPGVVDGQGSLACCTPWQARSWTWLSNWTEVNWDSWYRVYCFSVYSIMIQVLANKKLDNSFKLVSQLIFLWSYIPKRFFLIFSLIKSDSCFQFRR